MLLLLSGGPLAAAEADKPKPSVRPAFGASAAVQDDWIGKRNPYAPEYNLHDALGLPDWVSFSVENRLRYESMDGQFRANGVGGDQALPMQTDAWLELRHNGFRAGVEFLDARQFLSDSGSEIGFSGGRAVNLNNTEVNEADFLQIYGAWSGENVAESGVDMEVKLGRQTLDMGSRRLIGRNVFRNAVNSFTGALFRFRDNKDKWQLRLFGVQPVERFPTASADLMNGRHRFDEEAYRAYLGGGMAEWFDVAYKVNAEAYLYYLNEADRPGVLTADRELFTPGVRFYRKPAKDQFDFEAETIAQVGNSHATTAATDRKTLSNQAWFQHVEAGYTFDLPWSPRFMAMYDYASGDHSSRDGVNGRFDTLYGVRRADFNPTGIFGAVARGNVNSPGYRVFLAPRDDVTAFVGHRLVWLADRKDEWVGTGLRDATGKSGDFVGHLIEASTRWDVSSNLALETGWTHLIKGEFARNAVTSPATRTAAAVAAPRDKQDVDYFYVQSLVRF
ncbi:alginate export family protein [Methylogaea oryzae]|uniref:Alginate export domain-containing protein n=1 Tax=Methylogaea oryzae TaxID=1295382 RepID=A0A8D4VNK0_9GAMM|nr:alginate export family protein [Methylogaea oryzae]BBL70792.1 hypothetical protein MoryE10_13980 [Methylogaea oryzae]